MWFNVISSSSLFFPLIAGLFFYNRNGRLQTYFLGFIIFSVIFEAVSSILAYNGINNHWMFKLFFVCDFLFFAWLFNKHKIYPKWLRILTFAILSFIVFDGVDSWFLHLSFYTSGFYFIAIFLYSIILSFYAITTLFDDWYPARNPILWIAAARLIYYVFVLVIFVTSSISFFKFKNDQFAEAFTIINGVANILCNIVYGVSFLCRRVQM